MCDAVVVLWWARLWWTAGIVTVLYRRGCDWATSVALLWLSSCSNGTLPLGHYSSVVAENFLSSYSCGAVCTTGTAAV